ncbi:F-box domain-containing protein [Artemisia annua]|uniref:F-box domain-containing protein n=1 Tax=Artemisia annua TaxID=35608 RepID=A0A2U1L7U6_ARTAN|nr:F-box domain-containing protein [Artemisia annua]
MPWILAHNPNPKDTTITNNCFIYKHQSPYPYRNLPDLKACMFLASYQGWLLVFKPKHRSIFFFSPFSQSKIDLPHFPYKHIRQHATAFSDLPTSPHCLVFIGTPNEVLVIARGQTTWTRRKVPKTISRLWPASTIWTHAGYDHKTQTFYYFEDWERVLRYSVKDNKVYKHPVNDVVKDIYTLPFHYTDNPFPQAYRYHMRRHDTGDPFHIRQAGQPLYLCGYILDNFVPNSN